MFDPSMFRSTAEDNKIGLGLRFERWCLSDLSNGYDLFGNMKMPWFNSSIDTWQDTRVGTFFFTTLAGIEFEYEPFWDPLGHDSIDSSTAVGDFHFNTSYLELSCNAPHIADIGKFPSHVLKSNNYTINMTTDDFPSFNVWQRYDGTAIKANCDIWTQQVEIRGHCDGTNCQVSRGRALPYQQELEVFNNDAFSSNFFEELVVTQLSRMLNYNNWPDLTDYVQTKESLFASKVPGDSFDETDWGYYFTLRLMQAFNTWYYASQNIYNPVTWNPDLISPEDMYKVITGKKESTFYNRSDFKGAVYAPAYRLSIPWVIADLMSNTVLLAAAVISFWLRKQTLAPDIFGYVSSLTRDNPNIRLPEGGTALSGLDRARLLKDMRVRIVDVGSSDGVGRVILAHADAPPVMVRGLEKGKHYV